MANSRIPADGFWRPGETIDIAGSVVGVIGNGGILVADIILSKKIPGSVAVGASNITVSAIRGNGQTESTITASYRSIAKNSMNSVRISFDTTGGTAFQLYQVFLSAGTITFS